MLNSSVPDLDMKSYTDFLMFVSAPNIVDTESGENQIMALIVEWADKKQKFRVK